MSDAPPRLEACGLSVARGGCDVVRGVDLALRPGEAVALVGPNAAGKSTLVRALAGLLPASAGEIRFEGVALRALPRGRLARGLALVAPDEGGADAFTVEERVALGRYPYCGPFRALGADDRRAISRALERTGVAHLAARRVGTLSAGERQLAALARGLAQEPRVLLLDEPAAHLDVGHQLALFAALDEVRRSGVAVLAVVHDLPRAAAWAERMLLVARGGVAAQGAPETVLTSDACQQAFGVRLRAHRVAGLAQPLYSVEP
ncbi:MAG: ABC transporter ATP-binding protein [Vicinamibacteria bacterium]|nr:ABC transporter ATP-binding protein [Vicinamibacteria bacterium]